MDAFAIILDSSTPADRRRPAVMKPPKQPSLFSSARASREVWKANMTLRHSWFRVLLHLRGMVRNPRHWDWHLSHIKYELYDHKHRK